MVSRRLMEALRESGQEANMLVTEKLTGSPYVYTAASRFKIFVEFVYERLCILFANGFSRKSLFKIDTGKSGLPIWRNPLVRESDAIILNWVNQGMLSLRGVKKLVKLGKPVVWTMHDMWCMTGICHHAGLCNHYLFECGDCPFVKKKPSPKDLSHKIWKRKSRLYKKIKNKIAFVAVSNWLAEKSKESSLLRDKAITVIPNAFNLPRGLAEKGSIKPGEKIRILFGAARLDDPIKGLDVLKEMSVILKNEYPEIADKLEIAVFGNVKNTKSLEGFALPLIKLGVIKDEPGLTNTYQNARILVSASSYETLPGTLVEAQAYGCIPVSFNQGGQNDIVSHLSTGYLAPWSADKHHAAENLAKGVIWAVYISYDPDKYNAIIQKMYENVAVKFSYPSIAEEYLSVIRKLKRD